LNFYGFCYFTAQISLLNKKEGEKTFFFRQKVSPALLPEQSVQKSSSELEQRARRARTTRRLKIRAKVKKHSIKLST